MLVDPERRVRRAYGQPAGGRHRFNPALVVREAQENARRYVQKITTLHQSPAYPMLFMLSLYELPPREGEPRNPPAPYPEQLLIDYFRAYQPGGGYANEITYDPVI